VTPRGGRPHGFGQSRRDPFLKRTKAALADSARDRAELARRRIAMKLKGKKHMCRECGKTFYTQTGRDACGVRHEREARTRPRNTGRARTAPKVKVKTGYGKHTCGCGSRGCKGTYRNRLEFNDHARQNAERAERAEQRRTEQGRRTREVNARQKRGGRPKGAPKNRQRDDRTREERRAEWHSHRMQHAAGRVDRAGNRVPHQPSPRKVQPRQRVAPKVR
jgi:hypothetical protein